MSIDEIRPLVHSTPPRKLADDSEVVSIYTWGAAKDEVRFLGVTVTRTPKRVSIEYYSSSTTDTIEDARFHAAAMQLAVEIADNYERANAGI